MYDRALKKALNSLGFKGSGYSRKTKIFESGIYEMDSIRVCTYLLILLIMCIVHELGPLHVKVNKKK